MKKNLFGRMAVLFVISILAFDASAQKVDNFWDVVYGRTSVRQFADKAVVRTDIEDLLRAGMAAPTARDMRPWRFVVIDDATARKDFADKMQRGEIYRSAAALIVVCGDMDATIDGEGRDFWVEDCSAATENILLAATAKGLGAVWTGVYPISERVSAVQKALSLPEEILPLNVIALGYPLTKPQPKDKWDPANVHWNKW